MTTEMAIAMAACGITIITAIAGAVWVVGEIKSETRQLSEAIKHLSIAVDGVKIWVGEVSNRQNSHGERIARIEARLDVCEEENG